MRRRVNTGRRVANIQPSTTRVQALSAMMGGRRGEARMDSMVVLAWVRLVVVVVEVAVSLQLVVGGVN